MKLLLLALVTLAINHTTNTFAQALPVNRYYNRLLLLDKIGDTPSFAFSLRKLTSKYTGYAIRLRRSTDNVQADISFDKNNVVSKLSNACIALPQSSSFSVGDVIPLSTFIQSATVYATIWYDQSDNHFDAVQTDQAKQPTFIVGSAGPGDTTYCSLSFLGSSLQGLMVNQGMQTLLGNGTLGTMLLIAKIKAQTTNSAFGYLSSTNSTRWSCHLNWIDGNCYFDASENCCAQQRAFYNGASLNLLKHYAFIRGLNYKTVRVNGGVTPLNNSSAVSVSLSGGAFGIGTSNSNTLQGFTGTVNEVILFPASLSVSRVQLFESDQMYFWVVQ
jgi:hypothetical protein